MGLRLGKVAAVTVMVTVAACGGGGADGDGAGGGIETPTFAPDDAHANAATTSPSPGGSAATTVAGAVPGASGDPGAQPTAEIPIESVSFDDPVGDATPGTSPQPPPWSDLAGGALQRRGSEYQLTIRLGGPAPQTAPGSETMNIASFFDTDGDGTVDYELWVNVNEGGWGPVWYRPDGAHPGEDSNTTVVVEGNEVRLIFPDVMLDAPERLQFALASEYGELAVIGTDLARRDDAPDDDRAVAFP